MSGYPFVTLACLAFVVPCLASAASKPVHARLRPVPMGAVTMLDGFWHDRMEVNRTVNIPHHLERMEEHGFIDNFRRMSGRKNVERRERFATDADVFKWIEAASDSLINRDDPDLRAKLDAVVDDVVAAQEPDGYLSTWFIKDKQDPRFKNLGASHEFFNLGHLIYAGIAYQHLSQSNKLLDAAQRYADLVIRTFDPYKPDGSSGHPGLEMAMVELYRVTGERKYLDFCKFLLDWANFTDKQQIEGHCVREVYRCAGATDYYLETGDEAYRVTVERLWRDMTTSKLHVHGGIGSVYGAEAFGMPYQLPTLYGFSETCASVANVLWNARLLQIDGDARYADLIERTLYNALLAGVALKGDAYGYVNPLASIGKFQREPWQPIPCCLPNAQRLLASLPGYLYGTSDEGIWIHQYAVSTLTWHTNDGKPIKLRQETDYPWDNHVVITIEDAPAKEMGLFMRAPRWSEEARMQLDRADGGTTESAMGEGYLEWRRAWQPGDRITLTFDMTPKLVIADPRLRDVAGRVAVQRGPLIYCAESPDNQNVDVLSAFLVLSETAPAGGLVAKTQDTTLERMVLIESAALTRPRPSALYETHNAEKLTPARMTPARLTLIPYYAWANRGPSDMTVWLPVIWQK